MVIYRPHEWDSHRPLITQLYSHEGKTLEEVRSILASAGFPATARMFKQRIRDWKLNKYNKEAEMRRLRRLTRRRKSIGKDSVWQLHGGRIVTAAEIKRYFSRKGVSDLDVDDDDDDDDGSGDGDGGDVIESTLADIRVSTPAIVDGLLERTQTPRVLSLPESFHALQIVNEQTRAYIYGSFDSRWKASLPLYGSRDNCKILEWRTWLFDAMDLIEVGKGPPAFILLNKVYDRVAGVLHEQHPSLLGEILELASTYKRPSQVLFREQLLRFLWRMASIVLQATHPLTRLLHQLLDHTARASLVDASIRQAVQIFQSTFGPSHEQTLILHGCHACVEWETAHYDRAASIYRRVTAIRALKHEKRSQLSCWADIAEAEYLCGNHRYEEAEAILEEVRQRARYIESSDHVAQIMYALRALCVIHTVRGNLGMACALQRRAVELSQKYLEIDCVATEVAIWHQKQAEEELWSEGLGGELIVM